VCGRESLTGCPIHDHGLPHRRREKRRGTLGEDLTIWYDHEGDYLEVLFERKAGYFRETANDAVMEKVDGAGNVLGFSILKVSALKGEQPLSITLKKHTG
jgi:hypothetical protein